MRKLTPIFVLTMLFAACGSDDDDGPESRGEFCERWAAAACADAVVSACQAADADDCRASQFSFCSAELPATGFSGETADECIDAVAAAYADTDLTAEELGTVLRFAAPCDRLVSGSTDEGASCDTREDCDAPAGYDCVFKGAALTGTCQLPVSVGAGQDCSAENAVCSDGFYCNGDNCIAGENIGDPCVSNRQCGSAGFCGAAGVCEARRAVNATCGFDEQCESGLCYQFSDTEQVCTDLVRLSRSEPLCEDLR